MTSDKKSANLMRQIDENLRRVYRQDDDLEVPDRFQKLLEQLKAREGQDGSRDSTDD